MRHVRPAALVALALALGASAVAAPACQDPTQVTLDLSIARADACARIAKGTTITVGVEPALTEQRIESGFVDARTDRCDGTSGQIGTLVVTPSESGRAAVIVIAGFDGVSPDACKPPDYVGCIVARRRFNFAEGTPLRMPIVLDPECAGVACDAFSTCSRGFCFSSEVECAGDECPRPGETRDGAVDEAGLVIPEAGPPSRDAAVDAARTPTFCEGTQLRCGRDPALDSCKACCLDTTLCECEPEARACCPGAAGDPCGDGFVCEPLANTGHGRCVRPPVPATACVTEGMFCHESVLCDGPDWTCCSNGDTCVFDVVECAGGARECCDDFDCRDGEQCIETPAGGGLGHCTP